MNYGGLFDTSENKDKLKNLEEKMSTTNFWNDRVSAQKTIDEFNALSKSRNDVFKLKEDIDSYMEMTNEDDTEVFDFLENESFELVKKIDDYEIKLLLNGKYDINDAVVEIHAGAGGTEACDWADMLYRMYLRWIEKKGYKVEVTYKQNGLEVGIKSIIIIVKGAYAYGYLKGEKGIHRLIRISPFDSNSRRHTSFASVDVCPVIDSNVNIDIDEKDLRIDVYRSSGAGGQGVNTTDSAVRITHIPTGIVVTCQNERSQLQNKEKCMQILRSKLLVLETEKKKNELDNIKGEKKDINFGSQIRSYVMHPYSMVKDHITNIEVSNVSKVLDGDIDLFLKESLKGNKK